MEAKNWSNLTQSKNLSILKSFQPMKFQATTQAKQPIHQQAKPKPAAPINEANHLEVPISYGPIYA